MYITFHIKSVYYNGIHLIIVLAIVSSVTQIQGVRRFDFSDLKSLKI